MPLTGDELKAKLAELGQTDEATAAIACGYTTKAGKASLGSFRQAQLAAHGLALSKPRGASGRKGRALSFAVTAGKTGSVMLAAGYAALIGVEAGDQVQIAHHDHQLVITKAGTTPTVTASEPIAVPAVVTYDTAPQAEPQLAPF